MEDEARKPNVNPTPESMPEWWEPLRPPEVLDDHKIYRGKDGRWYHADGRIANRKERRAAGVR